MSSVLSCLFRNCFEHDHANQSEGGHSSAYLHRTGDAQDENAMGRRNPADPSSRRRPGERGDRIRYISAPRSSSMRQEEDWEEDFMAADEHHTPQEEECHAQPIHGEQPTPCWGGLMGLVRRMSAHAHSAIAPAPATSPSETEHFTKAEDHTSYFTPLKLKEAQTFILSGERGKDAYPSIPLNEIVMPGSDVQRAMAKQMQLELDLMSESIHNHDECVICMDGFTPDNPRMPTLCGCGENKTYFHLPCLYQWIDQSRCCPSCRQKLVWEEF